MLKRKTVRNEEVNNSKKLIEYTMEENYRLLFDLPLLSRKKEFGKDRLRNTIIRQFGKHQAMELKRLPNVVRYIELYFRFGIDFFVPSRQRIFLWFFVFGRPKQ